MKNHQTVGNRKVVFYGRVSTEHEAQTYALSNQMQWYEELKKNYQNWIVIERHVDDGITGTQAWDIFFAKNQKSALLCLQLL